MQQVTKLYRYPSPATRWRRLRPWQDRGLGLDVSRKFLSMLDANGLLDWEEAFIDGRFAPAKKDVPAKEKPKKAKERSGWLRSTAKVYLWKASLPRYRRRTSS